MKVLYLKKLIISKFSSFGMSSFLYLNLTSDKYGKLIKEKLKRVYIKSLPREK